MFIDRQKIHQFKRELLIYFNPLLEYQWFYLLGIFTTLAILHLKIVATYPIPGEEVTFYALYWCGILFLFWQNRYRENTTTWLAGLCGLGLTILVLIRPLYLWHLDLIFFRIGPIILGLGVGLLSFGFSGLRHYWRLFLLLCLMLLPLGYLNNILDFNLHLSEVTANISAFLLHYLGFEAISQGDIVKLPTGQVEVLYYCTGGLLIFWLLKITLLILVVVFPLTWQQRCGLILSAVGTGFWIGCIRVSMLALIVNNHSLFHYWHSYTGGSIFMAIATITYAFLCSWILPSDYLSPIESLPSVNRNTIQPQRRLFLSATWFGIFIATIFTICTKQLIFASILPEQIALSNWQQIKTKTLSVERSDISNPHKLFFVIAGQEYDYVKKGQKVEVQLLYELDSRGNINPFLQKLSPKLQRDSEKNTKQIKGFGYYTAYTDSKNAYLTACINPRGMSTVNSVQFMRNRYSYDLTWSRLLPWILGKDVLRDDRCIWARLSTPLNGEEVATSLYTVLESVWIDNYNTWQSLFLAKQ